MPCPRCRGLLVQDVFYDLLDGTGHLRFNGWRCVCCGNVLDCLIVRNQRVGMKGIAQELHLSGRHRCVEPLRTD
jgi:hypothetical protein